MKKFTIVLFLLAFTTIAFAAPIDFDNLNVVSTTYGIIGGTLRTRLLAAYNDKIYFIVAYDGTANPSKVYCYDPSDGWSNGVNHTILAETTGIFVTLRKIDDLLYFSDDLGNVYSYDGTTLTEMSGTPFTASDYVSSIEVFNGLMYFATYTGNIFRHDGVAFEQVYDADVSEDRDIRDMVSWQKDGYLYVSVHPFPCCPPNAYVIRSNTGNLGSWGTVFSGFWAVNLFLPTADYLYAGVVDTAYSHSSTIRRSSDGTTFPVIYGPDGQYKHPYGSLYHDGIAYFFTNGGSGGFGGIIVDDNGSVSRTINQNWMITQAVELNGEVYALAADSSDALSIPADVYLITTAPEPEWSFVHITDPHVGYKYKEKKNKDKATDDLDAAIYQIVSMSTKPDFILVTGDITHYGCDENSNCHGHYNRFLESIEDAVAAGIKVYVVPGNHDWSKPDLDTDCNNGLFCYNQTINPRRPADTESLHGLNNYYFYSQYNDILFIGLDTGGYVGGLSEDQISALMGLGAVNKLIPKVVFMHHPGVDTDDWWVPFDEDFSIVDHNEEFLNWCDSNNVQLVLSLIHI